jgi:endoglucanase
MLYTPGFNLNTTSNSSPPTSPSLANATYAALLLRHAREMYSAANTTTPYSTFSDSIPEIGDAYTSTGWGDDLCLAALSLALATNQSSYYREAYTHYQNYPNIPNSQAVWNWDSKIPAIYVLLVETALARPALAIGAGLDVNVTGWRNQTERYLDSIVNQQLKNGYLTRGKSYEMPYLHQ